MKAVIGQRVRLKLNDPDVGYGSEPPLGGWPEVEGKIIASVPALHAKLWYLMKLDQPLPPGFNSLHSNLPEKYETFPLWYLLLCPSPDIATADVPVDFIGECLLDQKMAPVLVSVGIEPSKLPRIISANHYHSLFPTLCSGDLAGRVK